ncbi:MAG TPA: oligosaccharide flippase family protein [Acidimicrobiales bacterium]|nr:oligosaccharide flippase family protein [Acidimicrobiales bacterium]
MTSIPPVPGPDMVSSSSAELAPLVARGAVINLVATAVLTACSIAQAIIVPRLLGPSTIGVFGVAMGGVMIGVTIKTIDLPTKLVQEREVDLATAYRVAFTLEIILASIFFLVIQGVAPLLAWAYHRPILWPVTSLLGLAVFSAAFTELPAAVPFRQMRYLRRRLISSTSPLVSFGVTVGAAFAGLQIWSLVAGTLAGVAASAVVMLVAVPVRPGLAWERPVVRRFLGFGWPIWAGGIVSASAGWSGVMVVSATTGMSGVGYWDLAQGWAARALQVDGMISDAVFPALCRMQDALPALRSAFVRMCRISVLYAAPVGLGIVLFSRPALVLVLGARWDRATVLVRAEGAAAVVNAIGYSWDVFLAARGVTRPQLTASVVAAVWIVTIVIPLLLVWGLNGAAASLVVLAAAFYVVRQRYMTRLFGPLNLAALVWRELAGAGAAAVVMELLRHAGWRSSTLPGLVAQGFTYLALVGAAYALTSRRFVFETCGMLRRR